MKKNIWENVYYRLKDPTEIRLATLFALYYADVPVSDVELKHFMLTATSVDFMDLCAILSALLKENHMKTVWRDETEKYVLTQTGLEMVHMFEDKIMASVRTAIKNTIDEYYAREREKAQLRCDIVPVGKGIYNIEAELVQGKIPILTLSLFAGNREKAIKLRRGFRSNAEQFYTEAVRLLTQYAEERQEEE